MTSQVTRSRLIEDLEEFAEELGKTPTIREMNKYGPRYGKQYQDEFGSWNAALEAAGLKPNLVHNISRDDVLEDIERVASVLGKTPTLNDMDEYGEHSKLTYQRKLGSFIATLEELGLEPSVKQYNFSDVEKPARLEATKNVRKLRKDGPTSAANLPLNSTGVSDKRHGLASFEINTGRSGKPQSVYYLFDEHDPEDVIRKFLEANPQVLENRTRKAITEEVSRSGKEWASAIRQILDEHEE